MLTTPRFGYRWTILALLFFATTINYIDRLVLGILAATLQRDLKWSETDYGAIVSWFSLAFAVGLLMMGRLMDRVGTRKGFAFAIIVWFSSRMIARGSSVNRARKTTMLIGAICVFAPAMASLWTTVAIVSLAAAAHRWFSTNLFTSVSDESRRSGRGVGGVSFFWGVGSMVGEAIRGGRNLDSVTRACVISVSDKVSLSRLAFLVPLSA